MAATVVLLLSLFLQEPIALELGKSLEGTVSSQSGQVHTPTLDADYTSAPTVSESFTFIPPETGPYSIELRSIDFNAYLIILDERGAILAEDDNGLLASHALAELDLEANHQYLVQACALFGQRGKFQLIVESGPNVVRSQDGQGEAEIEEWKVIIAHHGNKYGAESSEVARAHYSLCQKYLDKRQYVLAQEQGNMALAIREKMLGAEHPLTAQSLSSLGVLFLYQGNPNAARPLLERSLAIHEKTLGSDHPNIAAALSNLAAILQGQGEYQKARSMYERALAINEKAVGPKHPDVATCLNNLASLLHRQGKYEEARPLFERSLAIREEVLPEHLETATSLSNLAALLEAQSKSEQARPLLVRSIAINEKVLGPEHPRTALVIWNLANNYFSAGHFEDALPLFERSLAIREKISGPEHADTATTMTYLGKTLYSLRKYEEARPMYERSLAIREKVMPEHLLTLLSLNNLASLLKAQGNYAEARPLFVRALAIQEKISGPEHAETATAMASLSRTLQSLGKYEEALPLGKRSLAIREKVFGPEHRLTAKSLTDLGIILEAQGNYEEALPLYERALAITEKVLGQGHSDTATSLGNLAGFLKLQGNFVEARPMHERALAIRMKIYGPEHPDTAISLHDLAQLLQHQGSYTEAHQLHERALAIREKVLGPEHPRTALSLGNLADLLKEQGSYEEARQMHERTLAIRMKVYGPEHPHTATAIANLGGILQAQGNYEEARGFLDRALAIREKVQGPDHLSTAINLNNLASLLKAQGHYEEALPLLERALPIFEKVLGPGHPSTARVISNLAGLLRDHGNYVEARAQYERAVRIQKKVLGAGHPFTAHSMDSLAGFLKSQGSYEEARRLFEDAHAVREKVLGSEHPLTAVSLNNLAQLLQAQGDYEEALPLFKRAMSGSLAHLDRELPTMGEAGRLKLLGIAAKPEFLLTCLREINTSKLHQAYGLFQQWKGKGTRLQAASLKLYQASGSAETRSRQGRIQVLAKKLSSLILLPLAEQSADHAELIKGLREDRIFEERELNREIGLDLILATPDLKEVQDRMPEQSVLVDFYVGDEVYAWVLTPQGEPQLISLGPSNSLRITQEEFLRDTAVRGGRATSENGEDKQSTLLEMLWSPLREAIGESKMIFVCPDGFLCELPFGIIQESDGRYLLEKYQILYLADPTLLAQDGKHAGESVDAEGALLAVGGVNYFRSDVAPDLTDGKISTRSRIGNAWNSLPATKDELQSLRDLHDYVLEWESPMTVVEGKAATEERIRADLPGKRYVHIATHGYFEPDNLPSLLLDAEEKQANAQLGEQIQAVGLLPGLLSGLVFAGVNGEPDTTRDDGYLSAEEIQHLDLSACELVVLSACETALGSVRAGEGLMSLRRAFSVAGADTVISSLWKVDDKATAQLMKDFYTNLWQKGMSRGEALHQSKLRMLRRSRIENSGDAQPSTWGAFVLSGEWN